jgi:hypothetical protein
MAVNPRSSAIDYPVAMTAIVDGLSRLDLCIADFERRIAEERGNAGTIDHQTGHIDQDQMLQMLIRTLGLMKARRARLNKSNACLVS